MCVREKVELFFTTLWHVSGESPTFATDASMKLMDYFPCVLQHLLWLHWYTMLVVQHLFCGGHYLFHEILSVSNNVVKISNDKIILWKFLLEFLENCITVIRLFVFNGNFILEVGLNHECFMFHREHHFALSFSKSSKVWRFKHQRGSMYQMQSESVN